MSRPAQPMPSATTQLMKWGEVRRLRLLIADFQRLYGWTPEAAENLIADLTAYAAGDAAHYALGTICVYPDGRGGLVMVDGQQRMTTLMLASGACRSVLLEHNSPDAEAMLSITHDRNVIGSPARVLTNPHNRSADDVFAMLVEGRRPSGKMAAKTAEGCMVACWDALRCVFAELAADDIDSLMVFWNHLETMLDLVVIYQPDRRSAVRYFTSANHNVLPLQPVNLIMNMLGAAADEAGETAAFTVQKERLAAATGYTDDGLNRLLFEDLSARIVTPDDILTAANLFPRMEEERDRIAPDPVRFVTELADAAELLQRIKEGADATPAMLLLRRAGNSKSVYRRLVIAGLRAGLSGAAMEQLYVELARVMLMQTLTKSGGGKAVGMNAALTVAVRSLLPSSSPQAVSQVFRDVLDVRMPNWADAVFAALCEPMRTMKSVAASLLFAELSLRGWEALPEVMTRTAGMDVEHVAPQNETLWDASVAGDGSVVVAPAALAKNLLGNCLLLEKGSNRSQKDQSYAVKRPNLVASASVVTRMCGDPVGTGGVTGSQNKKRVAELRCDDPDGPWSVERIENRTRLMAVLVMEGLALGSGVPVGLPVGLSTPAQSTGTPSGSLVPVTAEQLLLASA
jgi:hypothetical protein